MHIDLSSSPVDNLSEHACSRHEDDGQMLAMCGSCEVLAF